MDLYSLGWTADRQAEMEEKRVGGWAARVCAEHRGAVDLLSERGTHRASIAGALHHEGVRLAVGDWVIADDAGDGAARVLALLERRSALARKAAGRASVEQLVAANLDTVFVVTALDGDLNPRRLERYVTAVWDGGAMPVVLVNKVDLADDVEAALAEASAVAAGAEVIGLSATSGEGLDALDAHLAPGSTVALVGSSGVGKSTIVNALTGAGAATRGLGVDAKGQHTTTSRQMYRLASGALLIDTPGMRELGLLDAGEGLGVAFGDIEQLAEACRFRDCGHVDEPGCAVLAAIAEGALEPERLVSYQKLEREIARQARMLDGRAKAEERKRQRAFSRMCRRRTKAKER